MFYYVILAHDGRGVPALPAICCCAAAWAISGWRSARTRRRRARVGINAFRYKMYAVVISAGHDVGRRRVLRVLLQQPVSRAGLPHLAFDRADPGADHRRHRHAVRPDHRRIPAHRPVRGSCTTADVGVGFDVPGAKQVFYGVCLLVVVMLLPDGVWPWLAAPSSALTERRAMTALLVGQSRHQALPRAARRRRRELRRDAGRDLRGDRPERRRQDDAVQHDRRRVPAGRRHDRVRRARASTARRRTGCAGAASAAPSRSCVRSRPSRSRRT